jgi:hypothetical protein
MRQRSQLPEGQRQHGGFSLEYRVPLWDKDPPESLVVDEIEGVTEFTCCP